MNNLKFNIKNLKSAIVGTGYVGLSYSLLLAQNSEVVFVLSKFESQQ